MPHPQPPAICEDCGTPFTLDLFRAEPGARLITNEKTRFGPCPNCGGYGWLIPGVYEFTDDAINVFSTWPVERLQAFSAALQAAQTDPDPRAAIEAVLKDEPELGELQRRLSSLRDPKTVIGFVTMLLTAIMLLTSQPGTTINAQTVIEKVVTQPTPTMSRATPKKPPPSPRKRRKVNQQKRRK